MKTFRISFITKSNTAYNGSIAAQVVRKASNEQEVMAQIESEMNENNKARFSVKAQELLN
jgi:hypothetical protein